MRPRRPSEVVVRPLNFTVRLLVKRLLLFCALATVAAGGEPPPREPFQAIDWAPTMTQEPTKGITLGTFRVQFETTALSDIRRAASVGQIAQTSPYNASESPLWLCYTNESRRKH